MALIQGSDITTEDVLSRFNTTVVDPILSGAYHTGNIPFCNGYQCVPTSMMDHKNNVVTTPNIGNRSETISAAVLLNAIINIVRNLTRVGTFSFILYRRNSDDSVGYREWLTTINTMSGKVIFSQAYVRTAFGAPANTANTTIGEIIKASNLNTLMANIYSHWNSYSKEHYDGSATICHSSCHYNCHSNCHSSCHSACHGWTIIKNA